MLDVLDLLVDEMEDDVIIVKILIPVEKSALKVCPEAFLDENEDIL